jgi:hypothetical protein
VSFGPYSNERNLVVVVVIVVVAVADVSTLNTEDARNVQTISNEQLEKKRSLQDLLGTTYLCQASIPVISCFNSILVITKEH